MPWPSVWEGSLVLLQHLTALLSDISESASAALNSSQPVITDTLHRAAELLHSCRPAEPLWPDLGLPEIDPFQANLLLAISGILVTNVLLVYLAWSRYGERIVEHFTSADCESVVWAVGQWRRI